MGKFFEELGTELSNREQAIYDGSAGLPEEKRLAYIASWRKRGGKSPPLPTPKVVTESPTENYPCPHRGEQTGERVGCASCKDRTLEVYSCEIYGKCVLDRRPTATDVSCCKWCSDRPPLIAKASTLPVSMVMPSDKRPHIYRGGVLQIHVTRACDRSCFACTQGSNLAGPVEFISVEQFRAAVESLKDYFGVVGIFGGNPTLHPQFDELCSILRDKIPYLQRGLWSNHPKGKGKICSITFNPAFSNLNVHQSQEAYDEFARDWPDCKPYLKGLDCDSRHSPPFVAMKDVIPDEAERWKLIQDCDVNKNWSALIGVFRGQLRGWFCELAGAQSMLHQHEPDYPDTGVPIVPGWWKQGSESFSEQVRKHCHECGVPLRGHGELANTGHSEQVSETHRAIYRPKRIGREVQVVTELIQLGSPLQRATDYLENGRA